ncbi:hypothetical protein BU14_0180s0006 [Porphyra umbilicalis]|uniref:Uncharacterized protein n=1 Tax=Porphyra umbilicalis TaxID=2786 RepID=A0A1X6P6Z8_PORUM|nr:hypothetical protein BU14_0180s0006 [Porphyra umbilicalis]|eukprot:OSX76659.1 hypothetical protein BU14_0180s0006 [Porphyra umbilicalis]
MAGLPSPTDEELVRAARLGYRRLYFTAEGTLPERRGPLPATVILDIVDLILATTDRSLEQECAGLVLSFLMCNRPGVAANLRARDVRMVLGGLEVQVPTYEMGILKQGERIAFRIPVATGGWAQDPALRLVQDPALRLVRRMWARHLRAGRPRADHPFAPAGHSALQSLPSQVVTTWLRRALALTNHQPPLGLKWSGHSLRAGAASAAHAIGLAVGLICQLMGLASVKTAFKHYIDAQLDNDPAARALFSRYAPRVLWPVALALGHLPSQVAHHHPHQLVPPVAPWRLGRHLGRARAADRVADRPLLARGRDAALGGASWRRARTRGRGESFYRGKPFRQPLAARRSSAAPSGCPRPTFPPRYVPAPRYFCGSAGHLRPALRVGQRP